MSQSLKIRFFFVLIFIFLAAGCASTRAMKATVRDADELAAKGAWDEAVLKYAEARRQDPTNLDFMMKFRRARAEGARIHYSRGEEHLDEGNHEAAILEFQAAFLLDPGFKKAAQSIKDTKKLIDSLYYYGKGLEFLSDKKKREARAAFKKAVTLNPENEAASAELEKLKEREALVMDGFELNLKSTKPITLEFKDAGIKKIFDVLAKLSGINFVFDSDVRDTKTTIFLKDATFKGALELILLTNKLKKKVVSDNTIIIYPATPQKAKQYSEMLIKVFYLTNIDAKNTVNLLRTMIKARDMFVHAELNAVVIRARPEAVELAQRILEAADLADAEVMLVVDIMEIDRTRDRNLGIDYPDSATVSVPSSADPLLTGVITLGDLGSLSSEDLLITIPPGVINFRDEDFEGEILANPRIRVKNNEKASIHLGERVPIITTTVLTGGQTQENVSYLDVGIKLDVEPIIRPNDEIDLKIRLEVSTITEEFETSAGGRFVELGTRNADTTLRLSDGETQIIGGLIEDEERIRTVKVPGLGEIPVIGRLFSSKSTDAIKTDILLSITPHIVRRVELPDEDVRSIWSGRQDDPSITPLVESFPSPEGPEEGEKPLPPIPPPPGVFPGLPEVPPPGFPPQP